MKREKTGSGTLETWTPREVSSALEQGKIVLIDVRTPQEFSWERIEGALLFPMHSFDARFLPGQDGKQIVLHCGSGVRSRKMAEKYLGTGAAVIAHMEGGMGKWKDDGLPYVGTDPSSGAPKKMRSSKS